MWSFGASTTGQQYISWETNRIVVADIQIKFLYSVFPPITPSYIPFVAASIIPFSLWCQHPSGVCRFLSCHPSSPKLLVSQAIQISLCLPFFVSQSLLPSNCFDCSSLYSLHIVLYRSVQKGTVSGLHCGLFNQCGYTGVAPLVQLNPLYIRLQYSRFSGSRAMLRDDVLGPRSTKVFRLITSIDLKGN